MAICRIVLSLGFFQSIGWRPFALACVWALTHAAMASGSESYKRVGAQTCGQSTCHAASAPWLNSAVRQNEYHVWKSRDRHAKAYDALGTENARKIAAKLGIENPATENLCLNCHADNVGSELRGRNFDIADGVTCETCHGGAERWLATHLSGTTFPGENYEAGMYRTANPLARAELCMSCHVGNTSNVSHRLLGAGHPRTPFELDTYSVSQPAHFMLDADYAARKPISNEVTVWATGQLAQARKMLERLVQLTEKPAYAFTEFSLLDCHGCHQPRNWSSATLKYGGIPRFNDAHYVMTGIVAKRLNPALGNRIERQIGRLHAAAGEGWQATHDASEALRQSIDELAAAITNTTLDHRDAAALMNAVLQVVDSGRPNNYLLIEQSVLAVGTLIDAQRSAGALSGAQYRNMRKELDRCYSATEDDEAVALDVVKSAFSNMRKALPAS